MDVQSALNCLGLHPEASLDDIKSAYRSLAKQWHPDRNNSEGSTARFQQLNQAYQTLISRHKPSQSDDDISHAAPVCVDSMLGIGIQTKENTFSVTIDVTDLMFLIMLKVCEAHHGVSPIDRGVNGQQFRFPYSSPGDSEHYGSISLTFYPTTSRLLVQGSSYLLWVDEHLPLICAQAEHMYMENASSWTALARRRGIGLKRESRTMRSLRSSRSNDLASADDVVHTEEPTILPLGVATITSTPITPENESSADSVHRSLCAEVRASPLPTRESVDESVSGSVEWPPKAKSNRKTPKASKNTKSNKNKSTTKKSAVKKEKLVRFDVSHTRCNSKCPIPASTSMIRYSLCMTWYHVECTGEDTEYVGVWSCRSCRTLPSSIHDLSTQMDRLLECIQSIQTREVALQAEVQQLKAENGKLRSKLDHAESQNNELTKLIETMSFPSTSVPSESISNPQHKRPSRDPSPSNKPHTPSTPEQPWITVPTANRFGVLNDMGVKPHSQRHSPGGRSRHGTVLSSASPAPHKDLTVTLIGSSIVRGVAPLVHEKRFDASGYVFPGRTASQINASIRHIPDSDVTVLAAGTNNIERQPVEQCKKEIHHIIDNVARKRNKKTVIMCQLPHRYEKPELNVKINEVNDFIANEVRKRQHWYLLKHSLTREDFKSDGLHFNPCGTAKYAHEIRHMIRTVKLE